MDYSTASSDLDTCVSSHTRSGYAERLLKWDGDPYSLSDYPMFRAIYDTSPKRLLLKTCRQVGKSMTLAAFSLSESVAIPHFKTFFIAPTKEQTQTFSTARIGKFITFSPHIRDVFISPSHPNRVLARHFAHGSRIVFSYASDDADRCRGQSCDRLMLDEVQDILLDVVRPVVVECLRTSKYSYETYCGTPKTFENGIEAMWAGSTQTEWVIKCAACGKSSILMSEKQCGKYGPVCLSCQAYLNPRNGTWVDMNYRPADEDGIVTQTKGFHISRLMMPQNVPAAWEKGTQEWTDALVKWRDVLNALDGPEAYPISTFRNEVLGVSDSQGRRLVTKEMLEKAQTGPAICNKPTKALIQGINKIAVGIDWSGGGSSTTGKDGAVVIKSRTVLAIVGMSGLDNYRLLYYKIFPGTSPVEEFEDICEAIKYYDLATNHKMHIGCDAGEGNMGADMLRHRLVSKGNIQRVIKFRYSGTALGYASRNPKDGSVTINRTASLDTLMMRFVSQDIEFPKEPDKIMEVPFKDILAEYEEVVGQSMGAGRKVWRHAPTQPDDFLHALNFAVLAAQFSVGKLRLTPHHEED